MLRGFQIAKNSRTRLESRVLKRHSANQNRPGKSLLGSTQFFRHLVENGLGLICIHDLHGTLLYVNAAAAQALGYDQSEGIGKNLKEFLAPRVQPFFYTYLERIRQHPVDSGLFRIVTKSGEERVWLYRNVRYEEVGQPSCVLGHAQDVTEYGQMMKEALDESERRYHHLFENANDAIATFSRDGKITSVNRGVERMLGWPRSELIGEHYSKVTRPASVTVVEERTRRYFAGNKPSSSTFEAELVHKDESVVPVEARTRAIHDRDGTLIGFQGIYRDITERKRADQALRESEERFRALIERASDMIVVLDADGQVRYESPSAVRVLGYSLDESIGMSGFSFVHPDDLPTVVDTFARAVQQPEATFHMEIRVQHKNGSWRTLEATSTNLLTNPAVAGIVVNSRDITQRKQAEDALRQSAQRLDVLHEIDQAILAAQSPEEVAQVALRYIQQFVPCVRASIMAFDTEMGVAVILAAFSCSETPLGQGKNVLLESIREIPELLQGKAPIVGDICDLSSQTSLDQILLDEGVRSYVQVPLIFQNELIGALNIGSASPEAFSPQQVEFVREVANPVAIAIQQSRLHAQVQQHAEELEQRVIERTAEIQAREKFAATGRMAARVAHEINNPLAGIKNAFRLIRKAIPQDHPSFQFADLIDKEIDRIADIVRHMYDLYRPEQEKAKIFRLDAVIHDIIGLLEKNCSQHKVRIILEPLQSCVLVKLPEGAVRQILFNLLVNAIDASPQAGVVEVSVHLHHKSVLVSVADHGKGIPQEVQEQIFQPFFTTKKAASSSGLGLGLSISKDLVEAMGGSLSFHSRAEQGVVFQVLFPLPSQPNGS